MSTKQKRKPKAKVPRKEAKPVRKRKVLEERKKEIVSAPPEKRPERKIAEPVKERPFFLAVRLLGPFGVPSDIENTMGNLRLKKRFQAVLLEKNESILGMLRLAKDYVAWGDVSSKDIATLFKERARLDGARLTSKLVKDKFALESVEDLARALSRGQVSLKILRGQGLVSVFNLHPPSGGFESSIKRPYGSRGELGYRKEAITNLIVRMM